MLKLKRKKEQLNFVKLLFKCDVNLLLIFGLEVFFHKYIHFYVIKKWMLHIHDIGLRCSQKMFIFNTYL
jgi:hypothetical protein